MASRPFCSGLPCDQNKSYHCPSRVHKPLTFVPDNAWRRKSRQSGYIFHPQMNYVCTTRANSAEPHITLHSHCNPIKYGKALIFRVARGSSPAGPTLLLHGSGCPGLPSTRAVPSAWVPPASLAPSCPPGVCWGCHNKALQMGAQ